MKLTIFGAQTTSTDLLSSILLNEDTFYPALVKDLKRCKSEVIIESPYITTRRLLGLMPPIQKLKSKKARVLINTRDPHEHDDNYRHDEMHRAIATLQRAGVQVLFTGGHHRKIVIVDRRI